MRHIGIVSISLTLLVVAPSWSQQETTGQSSGCTIVPIFHCIQYLGNGDAVGHFGYDLQCPEGARSDAEKYIDIGEDNLFSPGVEDRGQPKIFQRGKHVGEFDVEFSPEEVKADTGIRWSVLDETVSIDFSKTKYGTRDCSVLW